MIWKWILQNLSKIDYKTFLFFFVISATIWMLLKLSDKYNQEIEVSLSYSIVGSKLIIINTPENKVKVQASAEGFKMLLISGRQNEKIDIPLNQEDFVKGSDGFYYGSIATKSLNSRISEKLGITISDKMISPDTLYFVLDRLDTAIVPINLVADFDFVSGYRVFGEPKFTPKKITIKGPAHIIDTINFVNTKKLKFSKLMTSQKKTVEIDQPNKLVTISNQKANLNLEVAKYIEGETTVPIRVFSKVEGVNIKTFPATITVKYLVALPDYKKITNAMFTIGVEVDSMQILRSNSLIPRVYKSPEFVEHIKLSTDKVEFIITK
ncbi:MAG: hypothetical protein AUJ98_04680 [Bacteroidetes bacterium CG2_30_33_31]|nr:MAG: hypothetical protein AUJ98_04680 [Bacteroidetes bacterium CG2_30_33_31]